VSDDSIKLWDVEKRSIIKSIAFGINHYVYRVAASIVYKKIFIISNGFYCIDIDSGTIKLVYDESGLCEMNLSGDEKYISISGEDTIILFDTESLDIYKEIKLPQDHKLLWGKSIAFHPTEDLLVFAYTIDDDLESIHLCIWNYKIGASVVSVKIEGCSASEDMISFSECGDYVIYEGWRGVYRWFYRTNILERDDSVNPSSLQFSDRIIEHDGSFVVEKENLPLQQLINQVRENLNGRQLTKEERQKYYLD
jgi:WD40 repeat protein